MVKRVADRAIDASAVPTPSEAKRPLAGGGPTHQHGAGLAAAALLDLVATGRALGARLLGPSLPRLADLHRSYEQLRTIPSPYGDPEQVTLANHLIAGVNRYGRAGIALMTKLCARWLDMHGRYLKSTALDVNQRNGWSYLQSYGETRDAMVTGRAPTYSSALRGLEPLMTAVERRGTREEHAQVAAAVRRLVEETFSVERFARQIIHERCDTWTVEARGEREGEWFEGHDDDATMLAILYTAPAELELPTVLATAETALANGDGWLALQLARGVERALQAASGAGQTSLATSAQALCQRAEHAARLEDIELITLSGHSYTGNTTIAVKLLMEIAQAAGSSNDAADVVTAAHAGIEELRVHDGATVAKILALP